MSDDKMRAEFEKWAMRNYGFAVDDFQRDEVVYLCSDVQDVFDDYFAGYQAGQKAERVAIQKEALQQLADEAQELDMGY